jgi:hypothetical protein
MFFPHFVGDACSRELRYADQCVGSGVRDD